MNHVVLSAILVSVAAPPAGTTGPWTWANPLPRSNTLVAAAVHGEIVVAVGSGGTIVTSGDGGIEWTVPDAGIDEEIRGVVWSGREFVATSSWHTRSSSDGQWALLDGFGIAGGPTLDSAIWTASLWVKLVGGSVRTSSDGWA